MVVYPSHQADYALIQHLPDNEQDLPANPNRMVGRVLHSEEIPDHLLPANTVFVGLGSRWANPFSTDRTATPKQLLTRYELMLAHSEDALSDLDQLHNRDLICFGIHDRDQPCYAHLLAELASMSFRERLHWAETIKTKHAPQLVLVDNQKS